MCENNIIDYQLVSEVLDLKPRATEGQNDAVSEITRMENQLIMDVLKKHDGNKTKVAKELGISYTTLWRRLKNM